MANFHKCNNLQVNRINPNSNNRIKATNQQINQNPKLINKLQQIHLELELQELT